MVFDNRSILVRLLPIVTLSLMLAICAPAGADDQAVIRVMPLGDSITQGYIESYRRPLWLALKEAGINADFVGSMTRGYAGSEKYDDYDHDHEGHWGWFSDQVLAHIDDWMASGKPDIVLIHLGTNDIGSGQDITETRDEIESIILRLRRHNARIHVLLAAIIPVDHGPTNTRIREFNSRLSVLAAELDSDHSHVRLVDQFNGFDPSVDTYDGLHPNEQGNQKMAAKWLSDFRALLPTP